MAGRSRLAEGDLASVSKKMTLSSLGGFCCSLEGTDGFGVVVLWAAEVAALVELDQGSQPLSVFLKVRRWCFSGASRKLLPTKTGGSRTSWTSS